jgi:Glycosyltransferase family 87
MMVKMPWPSVRIAPWTGSTWRTYSGQISNPNSRPVATTRAAPTVFMNARIAYLPLDIAWVLQGAMSLAAVAAVAWTYWRRRDPVLSVALFVTASFLSRPMPSTTTWWCSAG